ncbi:MAG: serine/threonine protein kinase [Myxococcales bacterium]|nr:serine/threonine protein kinase [Myxococcales bacterium]
MNEPSKNGTPVPFGEYLITRRIARGGMAEIFRAQTSTGGWVALKIMRTALGHDDLRQVLFDREAQISTLLHHPNVVPIFRFGEADNTRFLAMEYIRGRNLSQLLKGEKALTPAMVLWIGRAVAQGLGHAHRLCDDHGQPLEIVHRDVSPGNIMIGYNGAVKVLDFGIARINTVSSPATQTGVLQGKFAYMSPEQTTGEKIDARSDVFSLGTLLYELLTGKNCFRTTDPLATLERVKSFRPPPPTANRPQLPPAIDKILAKCLAKDPKHRFSDGIALAEALARLLSKLDFLGRPEIFSYMKAHFAPQCAEEELHFDEDTSRIAAYRASQRHPTATKSTSKMAQNEPFTDSITARRSICEAEKPGKLRAVASLLDNPLNTGITRVVPLASMISSPAIESKERPKLQGYLAGTLLFSTALCALGMLISDGYFQQSASPQKNLPQKTRLAPIMIRIRSETTSTSSVGINEKEHSGNKEEVRGYTGDVETCSENERSNVCKNRHSTAEHI